MSSTFQVNSTWTQKKRSWNEEKKSDHSIVDDSWELVDPTPDVHALFLAFNDQYFHGRLAGCEVRWSPRMTLCAGLCCYEGRGGLCSIRLSLPLLKLRPRRDLVQTLLHEMIHAYLFVTANNKDHDAHGPEFQSHMNRINESSGAHITIYHSFHDEVNNYRQHWWRCSGACAQRKPYYGWVKRATNRAPGPNDFWWSEHQTSCGGVYVKVKEPEDYASRKKPKQASKQPDGRENEGASESGGSLSASAGSKRPSSSHSSAKPTAVEKGQRTIVEAFSGKGYVLGGSSKSNSTSETKTTADAQLPGTISTPSISAFLESIFTKTTQPSCSSQSTASASTPEIIDIDDSTENDVEEIIQCPSCTLVLSIRSINEHLDSCLVD